MEDKEFCELIKKFEEAINRKAIKLQKSSKSIEFFPLHKRDIKYDKERGGFIQLFMIKTVRDS